MGRKLNSGLSIGVHGQISFENIELLNKLNENKIYQFKNKIYPHKLPMNGQLSNSI